MVKFHDFYLEVLSPKIPMGAWRSFIISKVNSQAKVGINGSAVQKARFFAIIKMFIFCIQTLNILDYKTFWKSFRCGGMEKRKSDKRLTDKYFIFNIRCNWKVIHCVFLQTLFIFMTQQISSPPPMSLLRFRCRHGLITHLGNHSIYLITWVDVLIGNRYNIFELKEKRV